MSKIISKSEIPSAEEFREDMDRSMTWTERRLKYFLEWVSKRDSKQQNFIGGLIMPAVLGYTVFGGTYDKINIWDLLVLPVAYIFGAFLLIPLQLTRKNFEFQAA